MLGKWMDGRNKRTREEGEEGLGPSDHDHCRSDDNSLSLLDVSDDV